MSSNDDFNKRMKTARLQNKNKRSKVEFVLDKIGFSIKHFFVSKVNRWKLFRIQMFERRLIRLARSYNNFIVYEEVERFWVNSDAYDKEKTGLPKGSWGKTVLQVLNNRNVPYDIRYSEEFNDSPIKIEIHRTFSIIVDFTSYNKD